MNHWSTLRTRNLFPGIALLVAAIAYGYLIFFQSVDYLIRNDDVFYYFEVAKNFAHEGRWTFDGIHDTNGVQPLWGMVLSAVAWVQIRIFGLDDLYVMARSFLVLNALFNLGAGWYLYRLARRWLRLRDAYLLLAVWLLAPGLASNQLMGMESALYAFFLVFALHFYYSTMKATPTRTQYALFGLILGLLFLARVDSIFLIGLMLIVVARQALVAKGRLQRRELLNFVLMGGLLALIVLPYIAYNWLTYDHLMPVSGAVKRYYSQRLIDGYGGFTSSGFVRYLAEQVGETILELFRRSWGSIVILPGLWALIHDLILKRFDFERLSAVSLALNVAAVGALAGGTWLLWGTKSRQLWTLSYRRAVARVRRIMRPQILWIFAVIQFAAYAIMYPDNLTYSGAEWYFVPQYVLLMVALSVVLGLFWDQFRKVQKKVRIQWIGLGLLVVNLLLYTYYVAVLPPDDLSMQKAKLEATEWLSKNGEADAIAASYNAGITGYFARERLVNLDGLVNDYELLDHLKAHDMTGYIEKMNIKYLVEYTNTSNPMPEEGSLWRGARVDKILFQLPVSRQRTMLVVSVSK